MANDKDDNQRPSPLGLPPDLHSISDVETERGVDANLTSRAGHLRTDDSFGGIPNETSAVETFPSIEGYRIQRKLGQGGMGSVFLATDESLARQVAIKVVAQTFHESSGLRDRFESEIQTLAALQHPHIAQLFSAGSCQDLPYFVMEFVAGSTLEAYAKQPLKAQQVAKIVAQLCSAVEYCHQEGVLHRDLKPSNVLLDGSLQPKIADFGLAKAIGTDSSSTRTGEILGTPGYMAPEQASGVVKSFTAACDIYALGAILYRLLTGRPPFVAAEPVQAIMQVLSEDPIPPRKLVNNVPNDLQTICLKCLEKTASRRYQSALELQDDLQAFLLGKPIAARPAGAAEKSFKWIKRNPVKALLAAGVATLAIALLFGLSWHNQVLSDELAKTKRLADHGGELSNWLINDHLNSLNEIAGTTQPRHELAARVREFLNASYVDIPPEAKYTRRLGSSYARLASISGGDDQNNLGDHEQAVDYYLRALELYDNAETIDPKDRVVKKLRVSGLLALSTTLQELKKPDESSRYFELAKTSLKELQGDDWESKFLEIQVTGQEARNLMMQNQFESALSIWQKVEALLDDAQAIADQKEIEHQRILLANVRGECFESIGRNQEAQASFETATRLAEQAAVAHPENVLFQRRWSSCLARLGNLCFELERGDEALVHYKKSREILERVVAADHDSVETAMALAAKYNSISDVHFYQNDITSAESAVDQAIAGYRSVQKKGQLGLTGQRQLAICMQSKANITWMQGKFEKAKELYDQHGEYCQSRITNDRDSIPELSQLAENHFQQSLMVISPWMQSEFDAKTARESEAYKRITENLKKSEQYFERIAETSSLDANQNDFQQRIDMVRGLVEKAIDDLQKVDESDSEDQR